MDLSRGKVIIETDINEHTIDENVFFFEPKKEDVYDENTNLRYIFHNTFINTDEEIAISEFKKYCKNKSLKINKAFFENECLRYLYSAQFDFAKALDLIKSNYEFRLSNILPIKEEDVIGYINKGVIYWHGRDKKCRPILIINLLNVESLDVERLTNLFFFCFEFFLKYLCIPGKIENYISLVDCSGISLSKFPMSTFMKLLEIMNSKYRCRLFRMYIIDAPKIFKTFGKSFLNFAPSYMTKKLKILDANYASYLREEILDTQLEKRYGGVREIRDSAFYPFAFYPNCCCAGGGGATQEVDFDPSSVGLKGPAVGSGFQQMSDKARDFLMSGYSMHLKLVDRIHKESMRNHYAHPAPAEAHSRSRVKWSSSNNSNMKHLVSHGNNSNTSRRKKKKKNLSKGDELLENCFIDAVINKVYQIESNNILKNNKFVNAKGSYIVSVGSTHNWLFKVKHLFLPEITINYLTSRFPFIVNYLIVKSNFKSIQHYAKYIDSCACLEGDYSVHDKHGSGKYDRDGREDNRGHPYGSKHFLSLSSIANTTNNTTANAPENNIAHFRDDPDERNVHTLNSVKSANRHVDNSRVRVGKSRVTTSHAQNSRRSKRKGEGGTTQNGLSEFCAYGGGSGCRVGGDQGDDYTRRTRGPNQVSSKDAKKNFYANSESIFEDNNCNKSAKDKIGHPQNKQSSTSRRKCKEKTQKSYKIKATNNLFKDELVDHSQKVECVEGALLNRMVGEEDYSSRYDFSIGMDHSGKATASAQPQCENSSMSLTNATFAATSTKAANSIKTMNSMNTLNTLNSMNSANSEKKLNRNSSLINMKSVIPKRIDYASSKIQRQSTTVNTSYSTKQSKDSFRKLETREHLEEPPLNDPPGDDVTLRSNGNAVRDKYSTTIADVTHTTDDAVPTEEGNQNISSPDAQSDCTKQTKGNASDRSKRRLNKIKIIGLQFFNKTSSKM
ncbi:Sec14 protein, putative [Plasmodium knowlesi strain H]|uniref:Sec14 protein, putative n=3 Tax=Plasmodium knowlesi TaxID=5850 RepID=A0A5K1UR83_PLAKH|nr:CRAL/TRIO domain-containing protein, putative [Plasmodium knowlesi strain H]OTN64373.1 putative Sec14 protein [Plasmodium knowlesi]CAA9989062.1 CRAL/TRIO domain-containing protein, putative [Plasmodium knowlesi strain H]SBO27273.1 Sec14 protein, putative [Plasmodium knowlesi strain H]SBO28902.1 Sec14 protein, putative [Plasmodium knowlesi strain H]VVS78536.1 CRAL/TRIO domain-containing protein, putative [Plasmodium knowlesi strain H]|eukprot:XP_002261411.1 hypothetical protein, conserved in Plasmodium species [Plasmodium knowlesi strain H]